MSLSQDDFRKLLATPRAVTASAPKKKAAGPPPQTPKPNVELAKPEVPKKKKKEWRRPDHGEEAPQIRDRAKERREGINPDYEDSEAILDRLTALASQAADESESARQTKAAVYQQSKYLGGDVKHTHLVKGLDFALLKKVRNEIGKAEEEEADDERLEEVFEKDYEETESKVESEFASRICKIALEKPVRPVRNDLFIPGRMAFVWDIANATTTLGTDPFIPTTVIRSRSDLKEDSRNAVSDSSIVIDKISQLISSVRFGKKRESDAGEMKKLKRKGREEQVAEPVLPAGPPLADDEDIFADAGRDYVLEVKERASRDTEFNLISSAKVYFVTMGEDVLAEAEKALEKEREDAKVASTAYNRSPSGHMDTGRSSSAETLLQHGVAMLNTLQGAGTAEKVVAKSAKVSAAVSDGKGFAFGRRGVVAYGEEEMEMEYQSDEGGDDEPNLDQVDLGSKANKRRQLTRFDFETEEEFVRYKESQVHMPKAAFLYGVKSADGRKKIGGDLRNKEAAKLNKEMQQLDKMMTEKYGQSLKGFGGGGGKRGESGGAGASGGEGGDHSAPSKKRKI
ncbi:RED-like protein N-terminal region-domain-containing protein [Zopfochytrium polystomum]|nr:RED-like protein N-terminal region-domain-containing protein [Zopfochytrium polystomum]